ncbi:hypothetical protein SAY87_017790 [Trapa incisa]|uniref:CCG-binding protein 1 n=1 Tax=Trapa incisa TaxID=236973 RepID=A0AAN7QWE4_9MYRT|nr:hypothetical protein SAY87_017790 [Trapa incisa]
MESAVLRPCSSPLIVEARMRDVRAVPPSPITCSSRNHAYKIPKLEPFSRSKFERFVREPPLIEKCESELADYCSTLDGDKSYSCWRAYFELKDLEKYYSKEDLEKLIIQAGGVKTLVGCLHGISAMQKVKEDEDETSHSKEVNSGDTSSKRNCPIPDGLPKSAEELEEEEKCLMPDSPFTRLLRSKGTHPAWYSPAPDHETD